jgi:hypothetical protein
MGTGLKVALGMICFTLGAACVIFAVSLLVFDAVVHAAVTGALAVLFLWFAFALLRQVRWHNDK